MCVVGECEQWWFGYDEIPTLERYCGYETVVFGGEVGDCDV